MNHSLNCIIEIIIVHFRGTYVWEIYLNSTNIWTILTAQACRCPCNRIISIIIHICHIKMEIGIRYSFGGISIRYLPIIVLIFLLTRSLVKDIITHDWIDFYEVLIKEKTCLENGFHEILCIRL